MTEIRAIVPADLEDWIKSRLSDGSYPDPVEYLFDLARRDQLELSNASKVDSPEYIAWVRERIAEADASPLIDRDPREVIAEIVAERHANGG